MEPWSVDVELKPAFPLWLVSGSLAKGKGTRRLLTGWRGSKKTNLESRISRSVLQLALGRNLQLEPSPSPPTSSCTPVVGL